MEAFVEGKQYGLVAEDKINCNKSLIFVKLTDSALRSIEEYVKLKDAASTMPSTIQFKDNSGAIALPVNGNSQTYGFKLSNVETDGPQGCFECLQQNDNSLIQSLGCMHMKMHIHAKEDSYKNTRVKMAAAEQEQKKLCTKEIKPNKKHFGQKVQVNSCGPSKTALKPPNTPLPSAKKEQELSKNSKDNPKNYFTECFELLRQPIRNRIIHILATKPYKKAELLVRLKKEGVSDKDKDQINDILVQVAKFKGNILLLEDHVWNEIQEDWKFYTKEELQHVIKKKQQFSKPKDVSGAAGPSKPTVKQTNSLTIKNLPSKKKKLLVNDAENKNCIINQNESCVSSKNNPFTNNPTVHSLKNSTQPYDMNKGLKKELSLFSHEKTNDKHLASNEASHTDKMESTAASNLASLQASVCQNLKSMGITTKKEEEMSMETDSNEHDVDLDQDGATNLMTHNAVSVNKPNRSSNVPKTQVKQPNSCFDTSVNGRRGSQSIAEKLKYYKQLLLADSPSLPPNNTIEKSNKKNDKKPEICPAAPVAETVPEFNFSEIQLKYTKVETSEQRSQYVKDFKDEYEEYLKLQAEMSENSQKFSALNEQLNATTDGSSEYKRIKREIGQEFIKAVNGGYNIRRKKYDFLKAKLALIRKQIDAYDALP